MWQGTELVPVNNIQIHHSTITPPYHFMH